MRRIDCHDRIKKAKNDHEAASRAIRALQVIAARQPDYPRSQGLEPAETRALDLDHLHNIYFIGMFACFESDLRNFWTEGLKRKTMPRKTEDLISSIARKRRVPEDILDTVQEIREFRNNLVHGNRKNLRVFTVDAASSHLNAYIARLPDEW